MRQPFDVNITPSKPASNLLISFFLAPICPQRLANLRCVTFGAATVRTSSSPCRSSPTPALRSFAPTATLQQEPEHKPVRDQEQRYHDGQNEVGGTQLTRLDPDADKALIEGVEQIRGTPKV